MFLLSGPTLLLPAIPYSKGLENDMLSHATDNCRSEVLLNNL